MKNRVLVPELMDDPTLDPTEHARALDGLRRINAWTRNAALAWRAIRDVAQAQPDRPLRVLDVATGSADIPIGLLRHAEAQRITLHIDACDVSPTALEVAAANCARSAATVHLFRHDVLEDEILRPYDVVMCSQFLHHFNDDDVTEILVKMAAAATRRVVVVDLVRSRLNWLQVWFATRLLSRSQVVHFDGPQSIRAALTPGELQALAAPCGFRSLRLRSHWPCRMMFVGVVRDHE